MWLLSLLMRCVALFGRCGMGQTHLHDAASVTSVVLISRTRFFDTIFVIMLTNFEDVAVIFCTFYCVSDFSESVMTGCMILVLCALHRACGGPCNPSKPILRHKVLHLMAYCQFSLHSSLHCTYVLYCIQMVT